MFHTISLQRMSMPLQSMTRTLFNSCSLTRTINTKLGSAFKTQQITSNLCCRFHTLCFRYGQKNSLQTLPKDILLKRFGYEGHSVSLAQLYIGRSQNEANNSQVVEGIQKHVSLLSIKRTARKKKLKVLQSTEDQYNVFAYATSEEYPLEDIVEDVNKQGLYEVSPLADDESDAMRAVARYSVGEEPREIYLFREGSVVFWNFTESEASSVLRFLRQHEVNSYDTNLIKMEFEEMTYKYTNDNTQLRKGDILLKTLPADSSEEDLEKSTLEKYAFSNALALSVKLGVWEASLDKYVEDIEWVTEDLKAGRSLKITRAEVSRKTGELFTLRHLINLSSDLLDTPDFYWDREHLEHLYLTTCAHFNISKRTKVMNEKLSHCCELTQLLTTTLNDEHHVRLEWMIIFLILVEVIFEIFHYIEKDSKH